MEITLKYDRLKSIILMIFFIRDDVMVMYLHEVLKNLI